MKMRKGVQDFYKVLVNDEALLRLLYYPNDPLSPTLPNFLEIEEEKMWEIIDDRIKTTQKNHDGLDKEPKCRVLFYTGRRNSSGQNYLFSNQEYIFDVLVHNSFQRDLRLEWICDWLNELICNNHITGVGKMQYEDGIPIASPEGYNGYRLIFKSGSVN